LPLPRFGSLRTLFARKAHRKWDRRRQFSTDMGAIVKRSRKDGSVAWLAQIVIKRGGKIVLREN
jgi:hypothetical protein